MVIGERYRLLKPLKKGGMSRVFLAEDLRLRMKWAVKIISCRDKHTADAVISEANILRTIRHPNLVRIMDIFKYENNACLVMEYVEGKNLSDLMKTDPEMVERNAFDFSLSLMHALEVMHERKKPCIYRDMKPENIMIRPDLSVCLIDFGTSKQFIHGGADNIALGTPGYAAPEQFKGITDERSDIYSLGKTMEKMAGKGSDRAMAAVIKKALKEDPVKRYKSVREMEKDLKRKKGLRLKIILSAALLSCLGLVIASLYYGYRQRQVNIMVADMYRKTIEQGNEAAYNGDYSLAEACFTKAIVEINGCEEEGYLKLLSLYRKAEAPGEGLERMDSYVKTGYGNTDRMDELLFECGLTAFQDLKDFKKAGDYFRITDKKAYPESEYLLNISEYLSSLDEKKDPYLKNLKEYRDYTESLSDPEKKIKSKLIYTDICLILSEEETVSKETESVLLLEGYSQGKKLMGLIEKNNPGSDYELQALNMMSAICRLLGEKYPENRKEYFSEAISYMGLADTLEPGNESPERYVSIAKMYQGIGDGKNACEYFKKAEKSGESVSAYTEHMKYLESRRRYGELMRVYKDSLSINGIQKNSEFQKITKRMEKMELLKG